MGAKPRLPRLYDRPRILRSDEHGEYFIIDMGNDETIKLDVADLLRVGEFRWMIYRRRACLHYVMRSKTGEHQSLHRTLMDAPKGITVDHRDGNGLNNRRYNLRFATWLQNKSSRHNFKRSKTGYRGVHETPSGRYYALISLSSKKTFLGLFDDPKEAALVWDARARAERGEFTQLNFPTTASIEK